MNDRLADIERRANYFPPEKRAQYTTFLSSDVAALVEIAKAARHYLDGTDPDGYVNLSKALAVLDDREAGEPRD